MWSWLFGSATQQNSTTQAPTETDSNEQDTLKEFFTTLTKVNDNIQVLRDIVKKMTSLQDKSMKATSAIQFKTLKQNLSQLAEETKQPAQIVKTLLKQMGDELEEFKQKDQVHKYTGDIRIRELQYARVVREFVEVLRGCYEVKEEFRKQREETVLRQVKMLASTTTTSMTDEEIIQKILYSPCQAMDGMVLHGSQRGTVEAVYAEVAETHRDIVELQTRFVEVHELFRDFATLVERQDALIDNIMMNVKTAVEYAADGVALLNSARKYQKKIPRFLT